MAQSGEPRDEFRWSGLACVIAALRELIGENS